MEVECRFTALLLKIRNSGVDFGPAMRKLTLSQVESTGKGSLFDLGNSTNRNSAMRALQWWSNRLNPMRRSGVMERGKRLIWIELVVLRESNRIVGMDK